MPLFQCDVCGVIENTALGCNAKWKEKLMDWSYAPDRKGMALCSLHAPPYYIDGTKTKYGVWHSQFARHELPLGEYETDPETGGLRHKVTKLKLKLD